MMDERTLIDKLIKIETLFAGATTEGERISAEMARQRILSRLQDLLPKDPPIEYRFTFSDMWSRKVFTALLRRYDLTPYRYYRQRYTTVMVRVPKTFVDETLWPEFESLNDELGTYLKDVTDRVVKTVLHEDSSDAMAVREPLQIGTESGAPGEDGATSEDETIGGASDSPTTDPSKNRNKKNRGKKKDKKKRKKKRKGKR